jgi:serine/threonine protein kinase
MAPLLVVGRYQCHERIGSGGLAEIFRATVAGALGFEATVALKLLHPHLHDQPAIRDLFISEAKITASLRHPNIVTVHELGEAEGRLYLVMEYLEGVDLRALLDRLSAAGRLMPAPIALTIAMEVGAALEHAHACLPRRRREAVPILHRDLSPGNVMIGHNGAVKVLDFGVAKALVGDDDTDRVTRGKWQYMSPEQVRGEALDGRSDLFGLGCLLYEMLTGAQAFGGATVVDCMRKVEQANLPPAPGIDPLVEDVILKLLAREREARYPDASAAVEAMAQVLLRQGHHVSRRDLAEHLAGSTSEPAPEPRGPAPSLDIPDLERLLRVGDHTDQLTIPHREPAPSPAARSAPAGAAGARGRDPGLTATGRRSRKARADREPPTGEHTAEQRTSTFAGPSSARLETGPIPAAPAEPRPDAAAPRAAPERSTASEVYFDHFMPRDSVPRVTVKPTVWTPRNLLVLGLALLSIVIAATAILIAVLQRRDGPARRPAAGPTVVSVTGDAGPRDAAVRSLPAGPDAATPRTDPPRVPPADAAAAPDATAPAPAPDAGPLGTGELEVVTVPPGAAVTIDEAPVGISPARLKLAAGKRFGVHLSLPTYDPFRTSLWMPPRGGRRLEIILQPMARALSVARPGETAFRVRCTFRTHHRVLLDGRDTGYDCPTPALAVVPTIHTFSTLLPRTQQLVWKSERPRPGQTTEIVLTAP